MTTFKQVYFDYFTFLSACCVRRNLIYSVPPLGHIERSICHFTFKTNQMRIFTRGDKLNEYFLRNLRTLTYIIKINQIKIHKCLFQDISKKVTCLYIKT